MSEEIIYQESEKAQTPSIKLCKNSKGYTWEIRVLSLDVDEVFILNDKLQEEADKRKLE